MSERTGSGFRAPSALAGVLAAALLAVSGALLPGAERARAEGGAAALVAVRAPAEIGSAGAWRPARTGDALRPGERVRTGWGGRVEVSLGESRVTLHENSSFRLPAEPSPEGTERMHLDAGAAWFDVLLGGTTRRFEVRTPEAVAAVRGTRFALRADGRDVALRVFEGRVALASDRWPELLVEAGLGAAGGAETPFALAPADALGLEDLEPWQADVGALRDGAWRSAIDTLAEESGSAEADDWEEDSLDDRDGRGNRAPGWDGDSEAGDDWDRGVADFDDSGFENDGFEDDDLEDDDFEDLREDFDDDFEDDDPSARNPDDR